MILILIIVINQKHSLKTDISYTNQNKPLATIKLERKRNFDWNNPPHSLFPSHLLAFRFTPSHQQTVEICIYEGHTISFQIFFPMGIYNCCRFWKIQLNILWDDWPIFMISGLNGQLQQQLEYTLLKSDCHSWWISKMQSDTLEERYAIKFCFKLGKNTPETYGMLQIAFGPSCMNWESIFEWDKRFKESRESVRDDERWGRSKEVNTLELIGKRVRLRVTMLRF